MSTIQADKVENKFNPTWAISCVAILIGLFFTCIGLSEFYNLKFGAKQSSYPFGPVNENPWYYKSASIYMTYNLISGFLFAIATALTLIALVKRNKLRAIIGVCMIAIFTLSDFISQGINYNRSVITNNHSRCNFLTHIRD